MRRLSPTWYAARSVPTANCRCCGLPMRAPRGVEVGNIFKLGTRYSQAMGCTFLDAAGRSRPIVMGSYGIGSGRLLACLAEAYHDEHGLVWPATVAPYDVHLVALGAPGSAPAVAAGRLYQELRAANVEVLYDDRQESPGVKFNDADLIGLPLRLTVSERALGQGGVEFKRRDRPERFVVPAAEVIPQAQAVLSALRDEVVRTASAQPPGR